MKRQTQKRKMAKIKKNLKAEVKEEKWVKVKKSL
ncbi:MAG: hypothetical protein XD95_0325 [Microgenomates bacterium 39_7]|nr:MAG: hypothetical protein XD95_0325 [Microgenomates bacterium 39_7]